MHERLILNIFVVYSIIFAPWWLSLCAVSAGVYLYIDYYESIFFGLLYDLIFADNQVFVFGIHTALICTTFIFFCMTFVRYNLNIYESKESRRRNFPR